MFLFTSLIIGFLVFFISIAFLSAAIYHLLQYRLPEKNYRWPIAVIAILFLIFVFVGGWIFSGIPWETL